MARCAHPKNLALDQFFSLKAHSPVLQTADSKYHLLIQNSSSFEEISDERQRAQNTKKNTRFWGNRSFRTWYIRILRQKLSLVVHYSFLNGYSVWVVHRTSQGMHRLSLPKSYASRFIIATHLQRFVGWPGSSGSPWCISNYNNQNNRV